MVRRSRSYQDRPVRMVLTSIKMHYNCNAKDWSVEGMIEPNNPPPHGHSSLFGRSSPKIDVIFELDFSAKGNCDCEKMYFLNFIKVGMLDWARPFPADASSTSRANEGPASSALPWPMAYQPWALAELTRRRPFVDTGRLVVIRRKLPSNQVTVDCGKGFLLI